MRTPRRSVSILGRLRVRRAGSHGPGLQPEALVASAYEEALGRAPDTDGASTYVAEVRAGLTRDQLVYRLATSPEGVRRAARRLGLGVDDRDDHTFIDDLYLGAVGRPADEGGRAWLQAMLDGGATRMDVTLTLAHSEEALNRQWALRTHIQNLHDLRPEAFDRVDGGDGGAQDVFVVREPGDIDWMESAILEHGYYEKPGIWSLAVDDDKRRMAELLAGLAGDRALEIGCSSGAVMEGLAERGFLCDGLEISRMAIQRASPSIRSRITRGDLLDSDLTPGYDLVFGLDLFEHLNPNRFDRYLSRVRELITDDGFVFVNSPAFGTDPVYGEVFPLSLPTWREDAKEGRLFDRWLVDEDGYPSHGHLIWASTSWWTETFARAGLYRVTDIERVLHERYDERFEAESVARRAFFLFSPDPTSARVQRVLSEARVQKRSAD